MRTVTSEANMKPIVKPVDSNDASIITVQQHILREQKEHSPTASGTFSWLLSGITLATKMTQAKVRRAGLLDVLGSVGEVGSATKPARERAQVWNDPGQLALEIGLFRGRAALIGHQFLRSSSASRSLKASGSGSSTTES